MAEDEEFDDEEAGSGAAPKVPAPRENPLLLGHEAAEAALLASYRSGRMPHAWILAGPRGVGKATLAFRLARFVLAQAPEERGLFAAAAPAPGATSLAVPETHPVFRRVASGGHADLLVVERQWNEKRNRLFTVIRAEDARKIPGFLHLTPAEGGWRVVIVDGADTLNRQSADALLKILEEPPARALLILVCDTPGLLPPTVRSRCRPLVLRPLPAQAVADALARYCPALGRDDALLAAGLAQGSIGRALALAADGGLALYRGLAALLDKAPGIDGAALHDFAQPFARHDAEERFALLAELLPGWLARMVAAADGGAAPLPGEAAAMRRLAGSGSLDRWVEVWENLNRIFAETDRLNLDRKQAVLNAFFAIEAAARPAALERA